MDPTLWDMAKPIIAGQVRHALTGVAGVLVAKGALQSDQSGAFVTISLGLATYVAGALWSSWQKDGQAAVRAKLDALRSRVKAIPATAAGSGPEQVPPAVAAAVTVAKAAV